MERKSLALSLMGSVAPDKAREKRVRKRKLQRQARRIERLHRKH